MQGETTRYDLLLGVALGDQDLGQAGAFLGGHHPAHHIAAEDVQDHVEVVIAPFDGPLQLGDVPRPALVRAGGQKFRLGVLGMAALATAFSNFQTFGQNAVHGSNRAQVSPFVQQLRPYGGRSFVKPATQSGESGHPVGAKRRWGFHDVSGGRFESM